MVSWSLLGFRARQPCVYYSLSCYRIMVLSWYCVASRRTGGLFCYRVLAMVILLSFYSFFVLSVVQQYQPDLRLYIKRLESKIGASGLKSFIHVHSHWTIVSQKATRWKFPPRHPQFRVVVPYGLNNRYVGKRFCGKHIPTKSVDVKLHICCDAAQTKLYISQRRIHSPAILAICYAYWNPPKTAM